LYLYVHGICINIYKKSLTYTVRRFNLVVKLEVIWDHLIDTG
jgi:hypothetical protein